MEIFVNDQKHKVAQNTTLADVLSQLKINNFRGVALAVNDTVVARSKWEQQIVSDGDNILIIKATQGG